MSDVVDPQEKEREKKRERNRAWRAANLEKVRERDRARYAANSEKKRERDHAWREANPEKKRERDRAWREANPEKERERNHAWYVANTERARETYRARRTQRWSYVLYTYASKRARKKGGTVEITSGGIEKATLGTCPVFKFPFNFVKGNGNRTDSPSLDRIDSTNPNYSIGGVIVISSLANAMKNSATYEELIAFRDWINEVEKYGSVSAWADAVGCRVRE